MSNFSICVLHNPDASFFSQDPPHWQVIVPQGAMTARLQAAFVPLNSTEIAILGEGHGREGRCTGEVYTFNTSTNEFNFREVEVGGLYSISRGN